jgi:hypothetical protein
MNFDEWIKFGYDMGYCSPPVCSQHDGPPTTALEDEIWDQGDETCLHVVNDPRKIKGTASTSQGWEGRRSQWRQHGHG